MARTLSARELAHVLGVHVDSVHRYVRRGLISYDTTPTGERRFDLGECIRQLDEHGIQHRGTTRHLIAEVERVLEELSKDGRRRRETLKMIHPRYGQYELQITLRRR